MLDVEQTSFISAIINYYKLQNTYNFCFIPAIFYTLNNNKICFYPIPKKKEKERLETIYNNKQNKKIKFVPNF